MTIQYRIAARTEAAGKYNPTAPRDGNEDSLGIIPDVGNPKTSVVFNTLMQLPDKGTLMVVADGMGGHNAGEVASQIAIETVRQWFSPEKIASTDVSTPESRAQYMELIVRAADSNIRTDAERNPEQRGMGSTIIMAWVAGNNITITWCGDSRAYRYNKQHGLELLSEDHSLVQDLVRNHQIKYEDTFAHPQGNVITRCLGGGSSDMAEPESRQFVLEEGDLLLLCSDGLSGVLFDDGRLRPNGEPYSDENILDILSRSNGHLQDTLSCLFDAARRCEWYDNVTAILFEAFIQQEQSSTNLIDNEPHAESNQEIPAVNVQPLDNTVSNNQQSVESDGPKDPEPSPVEEPRKNEIVKQNETPDERQESDETEPTLNESSTPSNHKKKRFHLSKTWMAIIIIFITLLLGLLLGGILWSLFFDHLHIN